MITTSDTFVGTLSLSAPNVITMICYFTKIGSLNMEGRESRRFRQVNCDIERSVPTQYDRCCLCSGGWGGNGERLHGHK